MTQSSSDYLIDKAKEGFYRADDLVEKGLLGEADTVARIATGKALLVIAQEMAEAARKNPDNPRRFNAVRSPGI